jgi:hypothetical protein
VCSDERFLDSFRDVYSAQILHGIRLVLNYLRPVIFVDIGLDFLKKLFIFDNLICNGEII